MEVHLTGPGMETLVNLDFDLPTGEPDADHPEGWEVNAVVPIVLQFTPENEGAYMIFERQAPALSGGVPGTGRRTRLVRPSLHLVFS